MKSIIINKMKSSSIIMSFVFLFSSCIMCDIGQNFVNSKGREQDFFYVNKGNYTIECGEWPLSNRFEYEDENDCKRFTYAIRISLDERDAIKLNAFELKYLDGTAVEVKYGVETYTQIVTDTIPNNISQNKYVEIYNKDTFPVKIEHKKWDIDIDSLPIVLRESGEVKAHCIEIFAETIEPWYKMKKLKVYYDFEVGEKRFISKKIKYKWRVYLDCRPKWF